MAYSAALIEKAQEEAKGLQARAITLRTEADVLIAEAGQRLAEAAGLERRALDLDELVGTAPQLSLAYQDEQLRGQRLREEAVRILVEHHGIGKPIHYRRWYRLLVDAGLCVFGKNPQATFLTEISRLPVVERVVGEAGTYTLDPTRARQRASHRLGEAERELRLVERRLAEARRTVDSESVHEAEVFFRDARRELELAERELAKVIKAETTLLHVTLPAA